MTKRAKRVDDNQKQITDQLRKLGYSVCILSDVGKGVPDLLIGKAGNNWLIELKDGTKPPSRQKLTEHEQKFHDSWRGQVATCNSLEQILDTVKPH